jgi:spermidine/putrescine transport system substrate-binding protein
MSPFSAQRPVSRRGILQATSLSAFAVGASGLLSACGTGGAKVEAGSCDSVDKSASEKEINFSNWIGYVDPIKKPGSTISEFEDQSGIQVNYVTDINDNEEFFAKVSPQLQDCKSTGRDIIVLTDWMADRMINLGWIQKLDHSKMPNVDANLIDFLKAPAFDPDREYSVPWQSGMTGICYNSELTDPVTSMEQLLTSEALHGKVEMLTEMRDTMGFMLLMTGADPEKFTDDEFSSAIEELQKYTDNGQIRKFAGNSYVDDMKSGNIVACEAWSGDVINLLGGDPYKWVPPEEGFSIWTDNMLVPNKADHKSNAEELMNFYYDPVNAAKLAAWNYYFCPVQGAQDEIGQFDKSAVNSEFIFLDDATLEKGFLFQPLSETQAQDYQTQFNAVTGG